MKVEVTEEERKKITSTLWWLTASVSALAVADTIALVWVLVRLAGTS